MLKIILASQSPARKKLLKKMLKPLGLKFQCCTSGYEEDMNSHKNPKKLATFLALQKAKFIAHKFPDSIIIGADTFITVNTKVGGVIRTTKIGKPRTIAEAKKIIASMSGKTIGVHSGIAVIKTGAKNTVASAKQEFTAYDLTKLKIKKMSEAEINHLAHQKNALQISGAFSIEGAGGKMITRIVGDYNNVIGLPIYKLIPILKKIYIL